MIRKRPATIGLGVGLLCLIILAAIYNSLAVWRLVGIILGLLAIAWLNVQLVESEGWP